MKFLYLILPLVSAALAEDLIKCPCSPQDCAKAQDTCACENTNIVNKYFCCDAGSDPAKDLGLKDCKTGKRSLSTTDFWVPGKIPCGGPDDRACPDGRQCINMFTDYWGICSDDGAVEYFPPLSFITAAEGATTTTITITTADTATVTSTIIVSFGDGGSSLSVPMSTSTAIDTTTVIPEAVSTSTVIEITTVPAPTLVSGSETTTLITSTMTALRARDVVVG